VADALRHVHFVAICGTGMGALAGLLHARGLRVTGSDEGLYPPMSTALADWGIAVIEGFRPENITDAQPDLVVIGNVVGADNPEARCAIDEGFRVLSFPDALAQLAIAGHHSVVVAGTHGKTTTTALVGQMLLATGRDPSLLVGGYSHDFEGSFREGDGEHFVVEGDEYDTVFFDKTPKFLHYGAHTAIITSVEFDHADIYRDLEHVKQAFRALVAGMPQDGTLVAAVGSEAVRDVLRDAPCRVVGIGLDEAGSPDWIARGVEVSEAGTVFSATHVDGRQIPVRVPLFGRFNAENALAALATVEALGVPMADAAAALLSFRGIKRRQEVRGEVGGVLVIDDFAHHPTSVRGTVEAVRERYAGRRIVAVFEPRTNTSRRSVFQQRYAEAFDAAHRVVVADPPQGALYSATGEVREVFSAETLVGDLRARGIPAEQPGDVAAIVEHLVATCDPGDVVLVMSNGAFDNIWERLLQALPGS
jgi:UDP-N-acetylmuramate: L-alanyl-gamma-D-glutamyl-meso-diaminopimelate ligase